MHPLRMFACLAICLFAGCNAIPDVVHQPQFHNPFPQLHSVAVMPFFNLSREPTLNGDDVAVAYVSQLQQIPGFKVVPVGVTKRAAIDMQIDPSDPTDLRRLCRVLEVDAIVLGAVTEYSPYTPPRFGLTVDWYAANPGFHPIPAGYGLPWGTPDEEYIPDSLVFEAEFALARAQLKTQTPDVVDVQVGPEMDQEMNAPAGQKNPGGDTPPKTAANGPAQLASAEMAAAEAEMNAADTTDTTGTANMPHALMSGPADLPPDWPDPRGFVPPAPSPQRPPLIPQDEPVLTQTRMYDGNDLDFTTALSNYYYFRDDSRFGGWQAYLQRKEDFFNFCCYMHITEMLAARGGAGKSRVVWRWPISRYER